MMQRFIQHVRVERPAAGESAAQSRDRLRDKFPRPALRRMTHLGMLVGSALERIDVRPDDALVYASSFAETRALEDFLASFPAASPLLFQTSIHPGAVQQVLIGRQQPVARVWPLAGRARLVEQALLTALLDPAPRVILVGGEERGSWLVDHGMASEQAFAFAILLTADPTGAVGAVGYERGAGSTPAVATSASELASNNPQSAIGDSQLPARAGRGTGAHSHGSAVNAEACPALPAFTDALADRRPLAWQAGGRAWSLAWS